MGRAVRNISIIREKIDSKDLTIIIPAAGEGTRMKAYGPKSLIELKPRLTILDYQVKLLKNSFPQAVIIVIHGYEAEKVINNSPKNIVHIINERHSTTNVVRSISLGLRATITNNVLIMYGDLICNQATFNYPLEDKSLIFIDKSSTMTENEVGCVIDKKENKIEHILYDRPDKWVQIIYLTKKELELFKKVVHNPEYEKWFGFEAINKVIDMGGIFIPTSPKNMRANDIDCSKDIPIAQGII